MNNSLFKNKGIGLIEVIIATVVVAVGLMAVASLQGELIGTSGLSKTRSEAKALCDTKLEQIRDNLSKAQYDAIASSVANDSITGSNEVFTRNWTVDNLPDTVTTLIPAADKIGPNRKRVQVSCSWGAGGVDENIAVQTVIAFEDLGASSMAAKSASTAGLSINSPSTNANSSDEINDATDVDISGLTAGSNGLYSPSGLEAGQYVKDNGNDDDKGSIVYLCADTSLIPFEYDLYTRRVHYKPSNTTFKEAIELFSNNNDVYLTCTRRIRFNGGVILPIRGTVYSRATEGNGGNASLLELRSSANTQLFTFNATESGSYCIFDPQVNATAAEYICYVGGNCINGPIGTTKVSGTGTAVVGDNTIVTECPAPASNPSPTIPYPTGVYQEIGPGGWRGKVGLLGIPQSGKNVCFAEELISIAQQQASQHTLDTARNYFARRTNGSVITNEGINRPFNCQDMVIIDGQSTTVQVHDECISEAQSIVGLQLASKNINRGISGTTSNNVIVTPDTTYCPTSTATSYTIDGAMSNVTGTPVITINDGTVTTTCTTPSTSSYSCSISTTSNSVSVFGTDDNGSTSCYKTPLDSSGCSLDFTQASGTRLVTIAVTGTGTGTGTISNTVLTGTDAVCVGSACTVATSWTGTITATADCSGTPISVTNSVVVAVGDVTGAIVLPTCTENVSTRTISGIITVASEIAVLDSVSVNVNGAICTGTLSLQPGTSSAYSCIVADNSSVTLEIAISPKQCTGTKKYIITSGTYNSTGAGVLTYDLGTVSSPLNINASITLASGLTCN